MCQLLLLLLLPLEVEEEKEPAQQQRANTELAEKTWHCCGQAGTFAIQLRLKFFISFVRCFFSSVWYGKKAKGNGKAKANKHANKPSRVESSCELRVAFASSSVSMAAGKGSVPKGNTTICVCIKHTQRKPFKAKSKGPLWSGWRSGYLGITYKSMRSGKSKSPIGLCRSDGRRRERRSRGEESGGLEKVTMKALERRDYKKKRVKSYLSLCTLCTLRPKTFFRIFNHFLMI